jgi:CheY-like chemotaxis protein
VLDIANVEVGATTFSVEPVRVGDAVADALSLLGPLAAAKGISLQSTLEGAGDADRHVLADSRRLHQVLVNFLANAVKYTPAGCTATVESEARDDGRRLRITVVDDGPGLSPEHVERLFTPFDRLGAEQSGIEGTGLGLAHSKALADGMGAVVGADSRLGVGSRFWIELAVGQAPLARLVDERTRIVVDQDIVGTVLSVEDNAANTLLLERVLAQRPAIRLVTTTLGRRGLELAQEIRPDLVALDLHLPDISGETVLTLLRSDERTADIPVIVLSADANRRQVDHLLALGASAYLTKPLDVPLLLAVVDEILGTSPPDPN